MPRPKGIPNPVLAARKNIYLACEDMDFIWDERAVRQIDQMANEGYSIGYIAQAFERSTYEVGILIIDRAKQGHIKNKKLIARLLS